MFFKVYKLSKITKIINKITFILRKNYRRFDYRLHIYSIGGLGTLEDIAYSTLFLASQESSFITGATLFVDGGFTAQ